jgi:hypothetical protein
MNSQLAEEQRAPDAAPAPDEARAPDDAQAPVDRRGASAEVARQQQALLEELGSTQESVDGLVGQLRAVDAQLEALAPDRHQHRLLHQACDALGELGKTGGAGLFWGTPEAITSGEEQMRRVRERVGVFEAHVGELEARRQATRDQIDAKQYHAGLIEDELFEAQEEQERLRHEWIVEREIVGLHSRPLAMPWMWGGEEDKRFERTLLGALSAALLLLLVLPFIHLPEKPATEAAIPEQVLHITMAQLPRPPPPPPTPKLAVQKPVVKPTPVQAPTPPTPEPAPKVAETKVEPVPAGLMAYKKSLAALAETEINPELGAAARINNGNNSAGAPERAMLTSTAPGSSGGINLAAVSRGFGGGGAERGSIHGGALTQAASGIGTASGTGRPVSGGPGPGRTDEEIQIVFDRHKSQLYRLYNLELRRDPTLQGKMILRLTIEPNGSVSMCALQASNMDAPDLATQVVGRVRGFDFGAKAVPAVTIVYPIDFLPAI